MRKRWGRGFTYVLPDGNRLPRRHPRRREIDQMAIPPAWTEVWICLDDRGHIQATGRDAAGRKQYVYQRDWFEHRQAQKFELLTEFGLALPSIRRRANRHARRPRPDRLKVLGIAVAVLDHTLLRVGNRCYERTNGTRGLTTLTEENLSLERSVASLSFRAKGNIETEIAIEHPRLVELLRECSEIEGQYLFSYLDDDGSVRTIASSDVNQYLLELTGQPFTAKNFRTWGGTLTFYEHLTPARPKDRKQVVVNAYRQVAERLHNTEAVCRQFYVHPAVPEGYLEGRLQPVSRHHESRLLAYLAGEEEERLAA